MATRPSIVSPPPAPIARISGRPLVSENRESTDLVAKLLAREDLTIVHRKNAVTASFDGVSRTLTLPIWQDMSAELLDMLVAHETGHALHTPAGEQPIVAAIESIDSNPNQWSSVKTYLNVVEDIRIEREIKREFPGVKRSFGKGYRELLERGFFELDSIPMENRTLGDRINLHAKIGHLVNVPFSDYERGILAMCENANSWEDVIEAAREAYAYDGAQGSKNKKQMMSAPSPSEDDGEENDSPNQDGAEVETDATGDTSESKSKTDNKSSRESDAENDGEDEKKTEAASPGQNEDENENDQSPSQNIGKKTSEEFAPPSAPASADSLERNLGKRSGIDSYDVRDRAYGNLPTLTDPDAIIIDYSTILDAYRISENNLFDQKRDVEILDHAMNAMNANTNRQINTMAREFERRRAAIASRKESRSNSGSVIDVNRLHAYRFSEEIFRVSTTKRNGKSHGLVMFVDWSGSMSPVIGNTVNQAILLAAFCRKVRIPFEIYGFTSVCPGEIRQAVLKAKDHSHVIDMKETNGESLSPWSNKDGEFQPHRFSLINILSSRMSRKEFNDMCRGLVAHTARLGGNEYVSNSSELLTGRKNNYHFFGNNCNIVQSMMNTLGLSATPLNSCILAAFTLVPKFRRENRLQIVSTVFLTDGGASDSIFQGTVSSDGTSTRSFGSDLNWRSHEVWIRTPANRRGFLMSPDGHNAHLLTAGALRALGETTKTRIIGFDIQHTATWRRLASNWRLAAYYPSLPHENSTMHAERLASIVKTAEKENFMCVSGSYAKTNGYDEVYLFITGNLSAANENTLDKVAANASITRIRNAFINQESGNSTNRAFVNRFVELISTEL